MILHLASLWLPPAKSTLAGSVDSLFNFIMWMSIFFFVIVTVGTLWFAWKYRMKKNEKLGPTFGPSHNTAMEIFWTVVPTILVFIIFFWGFHIFLRAYMIPGDAEEIKATAKRWDWTFVYDNRGASYPDAENFNQANLYVPVGRPIKMRLASEDVLHSFYIPDFRVKMDCVPNRYTSLWFEVTEPGTYDLFCTEYCGDGHSRMLAKVVALPEAEYQAMKAGLPSIDTVDGPTLYAAKCAACHSLDGKPGVGPSFQGLFGKTESLADGSTVEVDENYLLESIRNPQAKIVNGFQPIMPAFPEDQLPADHVDMLIDFIKEQK